MSVHMYMYMYIIMIVMSWVYVFPIFTLYYQVMTDVITGNAD